MTDWPFGALQPAHYRLIYADPPWRFAAGPSKNPSRHYPTMKVEEIAALPVHALAHPDGCRLLMWITAPLLYRMPEVLDAWGFRYSSARFWGKLWPREDGAFLYPDSFARGSGYEVIGNVEVLVIAKRKKAPPVIGRKPASLFFARRREHSRKPDLVREEALRLYAGPHAELFGRTSAEGWDTWGNETGKFDGEAA